VHHLVLDDWSRGSGPLHRRDPRAKLVALLVFLISVATAGRGFGKVALADLGLLLMLAVWARLPVAGVVARAAVVLPFTLTFAAISLAAGDPERAGMLLGKSYLSALAVLLTVASTPLPSLLRGLGQLGVPPFLVMVAQFLYRYLFVLTEEAQHMRIAAASRASGRLTFRAAAGALAVLFARAHAHAAGIHQAMLARGFAGTFRPLDPPRFGWADVLFLAPATMVPVLTALLAGGVWQ